MRELNYNDPQDKTLCDHIILCYQIKNGANTFRSTSFNKGKDFYEWGAQNKLWQRRHEAVRIIVGRRYDPDVALVRIVNLSGKTLVKFLVPLQDYQNWGK